MALSNHQCSLHLKFKPKRGTVEFILPKNHFKLKKLVEGFQNASVGVLRRETTEFRKA